MVPFLKLLMDLEVMIPFVYPEKVVMGVVGPGGAGLDLPVILIMSVGTIQIPFLMCTLEIPQNCSTSSCS